MGNNTELGPQFHHIAASPNHIITRRNLPMTPTSPPPDVLTSNLLIDPRWSSISQLYGSAQDLIDAEQRYSLQNEAGSYTVSFATSQYSPNK